MQDRRVHQRGGGRYGQGSFPSDQQAGDVRMQRGRLLRRQWQQVRGRCPRSRQGGERRNPRDLGEDRVRNRRDGLLRGSSDVP